MRALTWSFSIPLFLALALFNFHFKVWADKGTLRTATNDNCCHFSLEWECADMKLWVLLASSLSYWLFFANGNRHVYSWYYLMFTLMFTYLKYKPCAHFFYHCLTYPVKPTNRQTSGQTNKQKQHKRNGMWQIKFMHAPKSICIPPWYFCTTLIHTDFRIQSIIWVFAGECLSIWNTHTEHLSHHSPPGAFCLAAAMCLKQKLLITPNLLKKKKLQVSSGPSAWNCWHVSHQVNWFFFGGGLINLTFPVTGVDDWLLSKFPEWVWWLWLPRPAALA